mmetsp:Transcript_27543/g.69442  ORF Transcript_27543/g.69442 Transcript_27543/m.69442 type:complete len:226 (-) Transcript_27543:14-691(-)
MLLGRDQLSASLHQLRATVAIEMVRSARLCSVLGRSRVLFSLRQVAARVLDFCGCQLYFQVPSRRVDVHRGSVPVHRAFQGAVEPPWRLGYAEHPFVLVQLAPHVPAGGAQRLVGTGLGRLLRAQKRNRPRADQVRIPAANIRDADLGLPARIVLQIVARNCVDAPAGKFHVGATQLDLWLLMAFPLTLEHSLHRSWKKWQRGAWQRYAALQESKKLRTLSAESF